MDTMIDQGADMTSAGPEARMASAGPEAGRASFGPEARDDEVGLEAGAGRISIRPKPPSIRPARAVPVIHISTMGNLGNQMIQYAAAHALASRIGVVRFSNVNLPPFGIQHPAIGGAFPATETVTSHTVDLDRLAKALAGGALQRVDIRTYAQRMENFLPPQAYAAVFPWRGPAPETAGPDELLCNIRQGDILDGHHPDYVLVPVDFYAGLVEETGLRPVFMGQLDDTPYLRSLRARFPAARFLPSLGAGVDFERVRRAHFIVPAISTFSWLAAWLSEAEQIFLPVLGLLNPAQNRGVNLLPLDDPRYRFYQFPIHYGCKVANHAAAHASLRGLWRYLQPSRMAAMVARVPAPRQKALYLDAFDEAFYQAVNPDIAAAVGTGHLPSGRAHYEATGFDEGRSAFALDRAWYCRRYPIAAVEIAQGEFWDADEHYLEVGRARGYQRGGEEHSKAKKAKAGPVVKGAGA